MASTEPETQSATADTSRGPDAVAESLEAVMEQSSLAGQDVSEDTKTKKRKCREEDLEDFRHRLGSFKRPWWFNKPLAFSALAAARRGWQNVGPDQLSCPVCSAELTIKFEAKRLEGQWMANGQPMANAPAGISHEILEKGHSPFCPWRSVEVKNDPQWYSDKELAADVETRSAGLLAMKHLPVVLEGGQEAANPADALASAGWEAVGTVDGKDFFRCSICLRTHIVQSFAHRETEAKEPEEISDGGSSARKKRRTCQPVAGLWTPQIRVISQPESEQAEQAEQEERMTWFDPHAFHHYYCPLFCHPEEELGIAAARMLKARSTDGSDGPSPGPATAAEKAESLVRDLHVILPERKD